MVFAFLLRAMPALQFNKFNNDLLAINIKAPSRRVDSMPLDLRRIIQLRLVIANNLPLLNEGSQGQFGKDKPKYNYGVI
jgi:hypothetical protein